MADHGAQTTRNHDEIRHWVEERGGRPSVVRSTHEDSGGGSGGILRIDFPGDEADENLEPVPWEEFFETFDQRGLTFLFQERTGDGRPSYFNKFIREGEGNEFGEELGSGREQTRGRSSTGAATGTPGRSTRSRSKSGGGGGGKSTRSGSRGTTAKKGRSSSRGSGTSRSRSNRESGGGGRGRGGRQSSGSKGKR